MKINFKPGVAASLLSLSLSLSLSAQVYNSPNVELRRVLGNLSLNQYAFGTNHEFLFDMSAHVVPEHLFNHQVSDTSYGQIISNQKIVKQ